MTLSFNYHEKMHFYLFCSTVFMGLWLRLKANCFKCASIVTISFRFLHLFYLLLSYLNTKWKEKKAKIKRNEFPWFPWHNCRLVAVIIIIIFFSFEMGFAIEQTENSFSSILFSLYSKWLGKEPFESKVVVRTHCNDFNFKFNTNPWYLKNVKRYSF